MNKNNRSCVVVTGASSGIGEQLARRFAQNGRDVVLVARSSERLNALARALGAEYHVTATPIAADLSDPAAPRRIHAEIMQLGFDVDVLVNNAGFNVYGPFVETDFQEENRMLHVNVLSLVALTKLFVPDMVKRGAGRILNLGSTGSFAPAPNDSLYAASKAFVLSFSEALAEELRGTGVTVTVLCPGPTDTNFATRANMRDTKIFAGRLANPREVAAEGYHALMRGRVVAIIGFFNKLQVWSMRFSSRSTVRRIAKRLLGRQRQLPEASHS